MDITTAGNYRAKWGEGPFYWGDSVHYVDIEGKALVRYHPDSGSESILSLHERPGCWVPRANGGFIYAGDSGIHCIDLEDGSTRFIAHPEAHLPQHRFNDGKCSPDGFLFAGTISLNKVSGAAALYRLAPDHRIACAFAGVTNSNGLAWSTDGNILYYIDTPRKAVLAFDYRAGSISNPRTCIDTRFLDGSPDGMTIDSEGMLWIAFCHGAAVARFNPLSGTLISRIELPCAETTSVAFGGKNLDVLYVTTGFAKTPEPLAGHLFAISGLGVHGFKTIPFAG